MKKHPHNGKPAKEYATVTERSGDRVVISTKIPVRRAVPGGFEVRFEGIERTLDHREVKPADWKLLRPGDKLRLPSKRGPRLWGRAMTPRRHRYPFTFSLSAIRVEQIG